MLGAITSTQQRLKLYNKVPNNGLVIYCGTIVTAEGKEKKVNIDFEPFKPINTSLYLCDNKFHTEVFISNFRMTFWKILWCATWFNNAHAYFISPWMSFLNQMRSLVSLSSMVMVLFLACWVETPALCYTSKLQFLIHIHCVTYEILVFIPC